MFQKKEMNEHATSRSQMFPTIFNHNKWAGRRHFVSWKLEGQSVVQTRYLRLSKQAASNTAPGPLPREPFRKYNANLILLVLKKMFHGFIQEYNVI